MPVGLRYAVERTAPYAVVRFNGVLNLTSAPSVRRGVADCLAAHPEGIVLDLTALRVEDPAALGVLAAAARDAARWPVAPVVLCCAGPDTAAALRQSTPCRYLPVYPTLEAAMTGMEDATDTEPGRLTARLLPAAGAARQARELVTEACARWDVPELVGPACTVVTELVNNVVVHVGTPMEVVLKLRDRYLNISVRDGSSVPPQARGPASPTAPGGRGLMMVEAVARRWGYTPVDRGKVVWAVLAAGDGMAR